MLKWRLRYWRERIKVKGGVWLAYRMPMWLKYWAMNDLVAKASCGPRSNVNVSDLSALDVLKVTGQSMGWSGYGQD